MPFQYTSPPVLVYEVKRHVALNWFSASQTCLFYHFLFPNSTAKSGFQVKPSPPVQTHMDRCHHAHICTEKPSALHFQAHNLLGSLATTDKSEGELGFNNVSIVIWWLHSISHSVHDKFSHIGFTHTKKLSYRKFPFPSLQIWYETRGYQITIQEKKHKGWTILRHLTVTTITRFL